MSVLIFNGSCYTEPCGRAYIEISLESSRCARLAYCGIRPTTFWFCSTTALVHVDLYFTLCHVLCGLIGPISSKA